MRQLFLILITTLFASTATAQDTPQDTITAQLDAFNSRDIPGAFTYASPMIQGLFGSPENFGMMVQRGYPMVWDNADVRYGAARTLGDTVMQRVTIRDATGTLHALEYAMIQGPDGWLINGVTLLPPPDLGV